MKRSQTLFLVKFFVFLVVTYLLIAWNPVNDAVIVPFTKAVAAFSGAVLNVIGEQVTVAGTTIRSARFAVDVNNGCNGVEAMLILLASITAYPATLRQRAGGLLIGALFVQLLNAIRIVSLFFLGAHYASLFELFHTAVWQIVIVAAALGFFLFWSARVSRPELANRT